MTEQEFLESAKAAFTKHSQDTYEQVFERAIRLSYTLLSDAIKHIDREGGEKHLRCLYLAYLPVYQILTGGQGLTYDQFCESVKKTMAFEESLKDQA